MSRGPLEVLRELLDFEERHAEYERRANHEGREAIAQVEALVEAAEVVARNQEASFSNEWDCLDAALAPFTPGQDSEGGGNG